MTSYPAQIFGLKDRGVIRPGAFADLVITAPSAIRDHASFKSPRREATGICYTIINGRIAFEDGSIEEASNGSVIRHRG
jgi:N-acyl-D-amino-acid deacylase